MEKGTLGYINAYKKRYGMLMLILAICIIAGTAAVYLIFGTVKHVAILIPIILALPFAKMLTLWIIAAKFHSMIPEDGELISNGLSGRKNCIVLYDMALSSYEAVSFASAVVIDQGNIYLLGHPEYDRMSLDAEYKRDLAKGMDAEVPVHYYENDDPSTTPLLTWRGHANTLYTNWLNFYVYQATPYKW